MKANNHPLTRRSSRYVGCDECGGACDANVMDGGKDSRLPDNQGGTVAGFDIADIGKAVTRMLTPSDQQLKAIGVIAPAAAAIVGGATGSQMLANVGLSMRGNQLLGVNQQGQPIYGAPGGGALPIDPGGMFPDLGDLGGGGVDWKKIGLWGGVAALALGAAWVATS